MNAKLHFSDFPIKGLLAGATRIGKTLFDGRKYHKPESFSRAQQDFRALNLQNVQEAVCIIKSHQLYSKTENMCQIYSLI